MRSRTREKRGRGPRGGELRGLLSPETTCSLGSQVQGDSGCTCIKSWGQRWLHRSTDLCETDVIQLLDTQR